VRNWFYRPWFLLAYLSVVLAVAFCVFRWLERPAQTALRRLGAAAGNRARHPAGRLPDPMPGEPTSRR
jgi:peptidoglycan/LPS O-acetylase OafA/YrhL